MLNVTWKHIIILGLLLSPTSWATPKSTTFQMKIMNPNGQALEAASVNFQFTTLSPNGTCVLYVEQFSNISMAGSGGLVVLNLGGGTQIFSGTGSAYTDIYNNTLPLMNCQGSGSFTPTSIDRRRIVIQFNDGSAAGWQTLPNIDINSVPYANFASDTEKFAGKVATDFILSSLLPASACLGSQVLTYSAGVFSCVAAAGTGGAYTGVTSVANAAGNITLSPVATTGAVIVSSGAGATSSSTGALQVTGGVGVTGDIYVSATINAVTSVLTPQLYGTSIASGTIKVDGTSHATKGNVLLASTGGKVGVGTGATAVSARLEIAGAAVARPNIIASGATVDLSLANTHLLKSVGGAAITLQNIVSGGTYLLLISDTTSRTYTFSGCTNTYFNPTNGATSNRSSYTIVSVTDGANVECYVSWMTGFN